MRRSVGFYVTVLLLFGGGILGLLHLGSRLEKASAAQAAGAEPPAAPRTATPPPPGGGEAAAVPIASVAGVTGVTGVTGSAAATLRENLRHPLAVLLLQVITIVALARVAGALFARIGQPPVVGEMVAGIVLGPSLLGALAPAAQAFLFPAPSLGALHLLSQVGVILFMFVVGIDLDVGHLRQKADAAVLVSHASIVVPFFLGTAGALAVYPTLAPAGVRFSAFALFMGVAMSITAFPVLARIIEQRGLAGTQLGTTAIACAAVGDATAWCLLPVVVAIAAAEALGGALLTIGLALAFIAAMLVVARPAIAHFAARRPVRTGGGGAVMAGVLVFAFAAALMTEAIGIHALFGAFLAGVAMPPDSALRQFLRERLETFSSVLLLPLFFAFTGLRTEIGLLDDARAWLVGAGLVALAIAGKLGGSLAAARWTGMSWGDSFALGALMNTRGLVELIVLNLGYDLGILSPRIFAMLVLMALVTTFMTGPLLALQGRWRRRAAPAAAPALRPQSPSARR